MALKGCTVGSDLDGTLLTPSPRHLGCRSISIILREPATISSHIATPGHGVSPLVSLFPGQDSFPLPLDRTESVHAIAVRHCFLQYHTHTDKLIFYTSDNHASYTSTKFHLTSVYN